jgi:hypothetical protein
MGRPAGDSAVAASVRKRSEENHRAACARLRRRGESVGFTEMLGCTDGADDDRTEFALCMGQRRALKTAFPRRSVGTSFRKVNQNPGHVPGRASLLLLHQ